MRTFTDPRAMADELAAARRAGRRIALVQTMGNLHAGHVSLIEEARRHGDLVVTSIFVNPLEFGANENVAAYPRQPEADLAAAQAAGTDIAFTPTVEAMLQPGHSTHVEEEVRSRRLCGLSRPAHFRGFLTGFAKLCGIVRPHAALFGQKDVQQAAVVRRYIRDLFLDIDVVLCPTVREADGLALNWRNARLSPAQRANAAAIPRALDQARALIASNNANVDRVTAEAIHVLRTHRLVRIIYVAAVEPDNLDPVREIVPGQTLLMTAVWVDQVRMIDNVTL